MTSILTLDVIATTIETTNGAFSVRTNGWNKAADALACSRVQIGENQFLIGKTPPLEPLTLGLLARKRTIR